MLQIRNQAVALAALALLASCSNDNAPAQPGTASTSEATTPVTTETDYTVVAETHLSGPGRWAMTAQGDPKARLAVFDAPEGYQGREAYVWMHDELDLADQMGQLLYGAPTRVVEDPCDPEGPSRRLGPSVEDFAEALVAQRRTTTSEPVPVQLDGYSGLYLELTTSAAVDFESCGREGGMFLWQAGPGGERVLDFPATDRYWILDVDGRRVVVTAMTPVGARKQSVERVTDVAEAITFVEAPDV